MLEFTKKFKKYVPAQQAKDYLELREAAIAFYESIGIKNPREIELSMVLVDFMLCKSKPDEDANEDQF